MKIDFRLPLPGTKLEPRQRFVLWSVGWESYEKIVDALNEQHVRVTYHQGDLELMSPPPIHEAIKVWFRYFLLSLAEELDIPFHGIGGPTLRRRDRDCGLEPDDGYYFAGRQKVVDWATLNLDRDPPPDLALEIDVASNCLDRMSVYAGLGVPEVWRFNGEDWHFHLLWTDGTYQESPVSALLPFVTRSEIMRIMQQTLYMGNDRDRLLLMTRWARECIRPLLQEWRQHYNPRSPAVNP